MHVTTGNKEPANSTHEPRSDTFSRSDKHQHFVPRGRSIYSCNPAIAQHDDQKLEDRVGHQNLLTGRNNHPPEDGRRNHCPCRQIVADLVKPADRIPKSANKTDERCTLVAVIHTCALLVAAVLNSLMEVSAAERPKIRGGWLRKTSLANSKDWKRHWFDGPPVSDAALRETPGFMKVLRTADVDPL